MIATGRAPRVLFCTDTFPPQVNGVSVVTATTIAGLRERGWSCAVIAPRYPAVRRDAFSDAELRPLSGLRQLDLPSAPVPGYADIRLAIPDVPGIGHFMTRFAPDLVHCETEFVIGHLGQRAARQRRIPVVSTYHTDFSRYTIAYGVPWLRPAVTRLIAGFHSRSARTYTPSVPCRDELRALGIRDVEVWGCGVDTSVFHPRHRSESLRAAWGRPDGMLFVHVGRLAPEKGVDRILEAYRLAAAQVGAGRMHLVIAGAGPSEPSLRGAAPDGVTFLGNLDRALVLPRLYASGDVFLFSSLTETLGLVVLEAMASGLPVIATPAGGVADHLRHMTNGLACSPDPGAMAAAMIQLVVDHELRQRLSAGARSTAERLGWDREMDRIEASYAEVMARGERAVVAGAEVAVAS
jgi:glycosyltransferase involved in cell wall biosynthesis